MFRLRLVSFVFPFTKIKACKNVIKLTQRFCRNKRAEKDYQPIQR